MSDFKLTRRADAPIMGEEALVDALHSKTTSREMFAVKNVRVKHGVVAFEIHVGADAKPQYLALVENQEKAARFAREVFEKALEAHLDNFEREIVEGRKP